MDLLLDAIRRAGEAGNVREAVVQQLFTTKDREGVSGKDTIDPNGDITLTPYGAYRIENGELVYDHSIQAQL